MTFQVGDTVKLINDCSGLKKGAVCILHDPYEDGDLFANPTGNSINCNSGCSCEWNWELISRKGEVMSKYDELNARIEKVEGWTKEADNLLQELFEIANYRLWVENYKSDNSNCGCFVIMPHGTTLDHIDTKVFEPAIPEKKWSMDYSSQCSKNNAFKQALMWLLDNSSIKKDDKSEKIAKLERKHKELGDEIKRLREKE